MNKLPSTNWINKVEKTYKGPVKDTSNDVRIAYIGSYGKQEYTLVPPNRVEAKIKSLTEQGRKPIVIP